MWKLLLRNLGFLFLAFAASAYVNVVPQIVFARTAPDTKSQWLSATLFVGTIACIAAVDLARRVGYGGRPSACGSIVTLSVLLILLFSSGFSQPWSFAASCIALRALCQYGSQETDRRAVYLAGSEARARNDAVSLSMRFAGMVCGPLFIGQHPNFDFVSILVYVGLAASALASVASVSAAPPIPSTQADPQTDSAEQPLNRSDQLVIWAARLCFACFAMLSACLLYVLRDLHGIADASHRGSTLFTAAFFTAMVATPCLAALRSRFSSSRTLVGMLPAPLVIAAAGLLFPLPAAGKLEPALAFAVVIGVAFAAFQLSFRDYTSHHAMESGRRALLAVFNNLSNTSALVAFGVMLMLSAASRVLHTNPAHAFLVGITVLGLAAFCVTLWARHSYLRSEP